MHSPGPWTLKIQPNTWQPGAPGYPDKVVDANGEAVVFACVTITSPKGVPLANTRLAAAAPDLLEALKTLMECEAHFDDDAPQLIAARKQASAAIAKAEGHAL